MSETYLIILLILGAIGLIYSIYRLHEINKIITKNYPKPNVGRGVITKNYDINCGKCHNLIRIGVTDRENVRILENKGKI